MSDQHDQDIARVSQILHERMQSTADEHARSDLIQGVLDQLATRPWWQPDWTARPLRVATAMALVLMLVVATGRGRWWLAPHSTSLSPGETAWLLAQLDVAGAPLLENVDVLTQEIMLQDEFQLADASATSHDEEWSTDDLFWIIETLGEPDITQDDAELLRELERLDAMELNVG